LVPDVFSVHQRKNILFSYFYDDQKGLVGNIGQIKKKKKGEEESKDKQKGSVISDQFLYPSILPFPFKL
jgi:hypothetical protein